MTGDRQLRDTVKRVLTDLVRIPSVNPRERNVRGGIYGEKRVAEYVARALKKMGIPARLEEAAPGRPNVFARIKPPGRLRPRRRILVEAHLDTVEIEGMKFPPFAAKYRRGRIYGRGAVDCKGCLAATIGALSILDRKKIKSEINFCAAAGEEEDMLGARHLMKKRRGFDWAVVGEPTRLNIAVAHKGVVRWKLTVFGVACHGARPEQGVNAIYKMTDFIQDLNREFARKKGKRHPLLGGPVHNVGTIEGGLTYNIVPDRCSALLERRTNPGETEAGATKELRKILERRKKQDPGFRYQLKLSGLFFPMAIPARHGLVSSLKKSIAKFHPGVALEGKRGSTDAGLYSRHGIPTVVFGPGEARLSHSAVEYIDLAGVVRAALILKDFLENN